MTWILLSILSMLASLTLVAALYRRSVQRAERAKEARAAVVASMQPTGANFEEHA